MVPDSELRILSLIESSDAGEVLSSLLAYLRPFSDLLKCREEERTLAVESLTKQFLPFLTKSVSSLQKRLSVTGPAHESPVDLFRAYDFCLECCELISLDPRTVQLQRVGLIRCYLTWGWCTHAYNDAFRVLEQLTQPRPTTSPLDSVLVLPNPDFGDAKIVLLLVASIVRSVALSPDMDFRQYSMVSFLLREIKPWLRFLDANDKCPILLVLDMGKCALSVVREAARFDDSFTHSFCIRTLEEYSASSLPKHHFYKFSGQLLSLLFESKERNIKIITSLLHTVAKVPYEENWWELIDLVSFCADKSQLAGKECCARVSELLIKIAAEVNSECSTTWQAIPQACVILRLYSAGLSVNVFDVKLREEGQETTGDWGLEALLGDMDMRNSLVSLLRIIDKYSYNALHSQGQNYVNALHYLDALKFLCQPLASLINFENKKVLLDTQIARHSGHLSAIQDMFLRFIRDALCFLQRWMPVKEGSGTDFNKILPNVAMAAFIVSLRTKLKVESTASLVEDLIASPWITAPELKYLFASFHDIGLALYNIQHLKKASSMVFKVCIRTVWTCIILLCRIFVNESNSSEDYLSGKAIIDFVNEACIKSEFYLDVLHQHGARETEKLVVFILVNCSAAEDLIKRFPDPTPTINQWHKLRHKSLELIGHSTPLYSLLSSSQKISKGVTRKILEQELLSYEEMRPLRPKLCREMQTIIADIFLKEVFITKDLSVERARILIWKARKIRASGTENLKECIHYLSEAISITHVFQDVNTSINLWLRIQTPCDSEDSIPLENMIPLLCNVIDLLAIKGWIELRQHIYELMFRLLRWKNVELEDCLAMLWDCRRLSHALCPCPINDAVILVLSDYFGEKSKSTDFWISSLQFSIAKSIGFQLSLQCPLHSLNEHEDPYKSDTNDINSTASVLVSRDPFPSQLSFVAASLYYDLCERQLACGNFYEALSYAEEAHRIRCIFFEDIFSYEAKMGSERHNSAGKIIEIPTHVFSKFEVSTLKATNVWPCGKFVWDPNRCYLSPWNVLQCYLESILQLGVLNELIGEGVKAERFLIWGKSISSLQSLPPFILSFSLALGNFYTRLPSLDLAAKELQNAKELLTDGQRDYSCRNCRLLLEVTLYKQLGDLSQRQYGVSHAESLFSSALRKLCCSGCISHHVNELAEVNNCPELLGHRSKNSDPSIKEEQTDSKRRRRGGSINVQTYEPSFRLTRSMCRSHKEQGQNCSADLHMGISKKRGISDEKEDTKNTIHSICICINRKCPHGLSNTVTRSGWLNSLISLKWQFHQRRLTCTVLHSLGKCLAKAGKVHQAHEANWQSITVLFNRNVSGLNLLNMIGDEMKRGVSVVDHARMLYNLCKLSLQTYHSRASRSICCDLSHIPLQKLFSWLKLAFVLSREVPLLYQKISRLLAALYFLSSSTAEFSFPREGELSVSHWVAYYHQASLGAHLNYQFLSKFTRRYKSDKESSRLSCMATAEFDFLRLAPENTEDLVKFAMNFFNSLSESTVICMSMLGGTLSKLLQEIMKSPPVCAWLLVSRLSSKSQPVAILLPVDSVLEEDNDSNTKVTGIKEIDKRWVCPWSSTVVDVVAPTFESILEDNFIAGSKLHVTDKNIQLKKREQLNLRLAKFLRKLEDSWLGPWRHLLLGESLDNELLDSTQKKLIKELRSKCKMEVNETLVRIFLQNGTKEFEGEAWISQFCLKRDHIVEEDGCPIPTRTSNDHQSRYALALQLIQEAEIKVKQLEKKEKREPIILVLDQEIQILPWESIPILRKQEVYRMPSVGSISAVLKKCSGCPLIDPRDAYYLLNPRGDLKSLQILFESWFKENKMKGRAGFVPAAKELTAALKKHDLFIYVGHGTGEQYIPMCQVNNMEKCAATVLMGCSSGSPYRRGIYEPISVPMSFLLAGSPVVVANLWPISNDINLFGKAMLEGWLSSDDASNRVGSFVTDARDACEHFFTGAAPVCYGVPTAIINKT